MLDSNTDLVLKNMSKNGLFLGSIMDFFYINSVMTTLGHLSPKMLWLTQGLVITKIVSLQGFNFEQVVLVVVWGKLALHHCFLKNLQRELRVKARFKKSFVASRFELTRQQQIQQEREEDFQQAKWEIWIAFIERNSKPYLILSAAPLFLFVVTTVYKYAFGTGPAGYMTDITGRMTDIAAMLSMCETLLLGGHVIGSINLKASEVRQFTHFGLAFAIPVLSILRFVYFMLCL